MRIYIKTTLAIMAAGLATGGDAAIVTVGIGQSFAASPVTFDFGGGNSVTFTSVAPGSFDPAGVSTAGTTQIASLGAPFYNPPQPTSYFSDRGGTIGPDLLAQFASYSTPSAIRFSITDSIIGLRFDLGQGFQYGYAQIAGTDLFGVRYQTTPGVAVAIAGVPEPASWAMLIAGFGLTGAVLRKRRVAGFA